MPYPTRKPLPFRRARLARALRDHRLQRGWSMTEAADALGWRPLKVSRQERSETLPSPADLIHVAEVYALTGVQRVELLELLATVDTHGWWTAYTDDPLMGGAAISYEDEASNIRAWHRGVVPALAQTEEYIRAMVARPLASMTRTQADQIVQVRATRKLILSRPDPPTYHAIVEEAALRRPVSADPAVMAAQIAAMRDLGQRDSITIQVVPLDSGLIEVDEAFVLLDYDDDPPVVVSDGLQHSLITADPATVDLYTLAWGRVADAALTPEDSQTVLDTISKEWTR